MRRERVLVRVAGKGSLSPPARTLGGRGGEGDGDAMESQRERGKGERVGSKSDLFVFVFKDTKSNHLSKASERGGCATIRSPRASHEDLHLHPHLVGQHAGVHHEAPRACHSSPVIITTTTIISISIRNTCYYFWSNDITILILLIIITIMIIMI